MDEHGNVIIKCIYDEIKPFTKQLLLCTLTKKNKAFDYGKLQIFDMDGNLIIDDLNGDDVMFKPSRFEKIGTSGYLFNGILKSDSNFVRVIRNGAEADTKSKLFVSKTVGMGNFYRISTVRVLRDRMHLAIRRRIYTAFTRKRNDTRGGYGKFYLRKITHNAIECKIAIRARVRRSLRTRMQGTEKRVDRAMRYKNVG